MNRDDDICWYHGKLGRKDAEKLLKEGILHVNILFQ